jgi:hypothetical protein
MHQTLDASIDALVGEAPSVAPAVEVEEPGEPQEPGEAAGPAFREGLRQAVDDLQGVVDQLRELLSQ